MEIECSYKPIDLLQMDDMYTFKEGCYDIVIMTQISVTDGKRCSTCFSALTINYTKFKNPF
jgi:hypothetical protein